jgi:hypothetical protein
MFAPLWIFCLTASPASSPFHLQTYRQPSKIDLNNTMKAGFIGVPQCLRFRQWEAVLRDCSRNRLNIDKPCRRGKRGGTAV